MKKLIISLLMLVVFSSTGESSYLKARGLWPAFSLKKVVVYKDSSKGSKTAFVAGAGGIHVLDVTDPFRPTKLSLVDDLPAPSQVQDLWLESGDKKPLLWVADGAGGVCRFSVSAKGLSKPFCQATDGFVYAVRSEKNLLLVANGEGVELWDTSQKEWILLDRVATSGLARSLWYQPVDPARMEPEPKEIKGSLNGRWPYLVGYLYVADDWGGIEVLKLEKVVTYQSKEGTEDITSEVLEETFRLSRYVSWKSSAVKSVSGVGNFLAAVIPGRGVKIFRATGMMQEVAYLGEEVTPVLKGAEDVFMMPFDEHRLFLFISAGRGGLLVFELTDFPQFSYRQIAETLVSGEAKSVVVDEDFSYYLVDRQAGLLVGEFPDFITLKIETEPCLDVLQAKISVSDPGPLAGRPVFLCIWLETPVCEGASGLSACRNLGFEDQNIRWTPKSYVLLSPEEMTYGWIDGRHCFPMASFGRIEGLEILRPDHGFDCTSFNGSRLNFCIDTDADLMPELCTSATW